MNKAISHFQTNISRVKDIGGLYDALSNLTTSIVDTSDLLRTQIVMAVSALDHYIYEITRKGMLEIYNGTRSPTNAYSKFQISIETIQSITSGQIGSELLENAIREKHSYLSFQHPDKIADATRLFSEEPLWVEIGNRMSMPVIDVKNRLKLIIERRNKIAHEADMDPSYPGARWPITKTDVLNTISFIENVCQQIHSIIS